MLSFRFTPICSIVGGAVEIGSRPLCADTLKKLLPIVERSVKGPRRLLYASKVTWEARDSQAAMLKASC